MLDSLTLLTTTPAAGGDNIVMGMIVPFAAMAGIMYFLLIRPQQQQRKRHQEMLGNLKKGDMVVTSGGLIGKIVKLDDAEVRLNLGDSEVRIIRGMIINMHDPNAAAANSNKKEG